MSATIDKKIVELAFDNKQFESGVGTSLNTIDKLKKGLNFDGAVRSLSGLASATRNFSFNEIASGIETISSRFTNLGLIGMTAIMNITNAAIAAGASIVKSLTVDPIAMGLNEYETLMNSVQTIMANTSSKGTTLDQVNAALEQLNTYSDKTIYNFSQMARNIGTFTAAGVDLDTSVSAIKGIANLAAVSGSNADQASTAMYQLSQALASGSVKLMDWNSVVNAGMGGEVFKNALIETAKVHGIAIDDMIKTEGSFRETLQKGWLTSSILTETLSKFTGDLTADQLKAMGYTDEQIAANLKLGVTANDAATKVKTFTQLMSTLKEAAQSGWSKTWQIVIGDFEEAKAFMTELNNIFSALIGESADARNGLIQGWKDLGGRTVLIETLRSVFNSVMDVLQAFTEAMKEIFPPLTAQQLYDFTTGLKSFMDNIKMGEDTFETLKKTFKGIFALLDIGVMLISALVRGFFKLTGTMGPAVSSISDMLEKISDFILKVRDTIKSTDAFNKAIDNIGKFLGPIVTKISDFFKSLFNGFDDFKKIDTSIIGTFFDKLKERFKPLTSLFSYVEKLVNFMWKIVDAVSPFMFKLGDIVAKGFGKFMDGVSESINSFDPEKAFDAINGGLLAGLLLAIKKFVDQGSGAFDSIKDILNGVKDSLTAWQTNLKADTLLKIGAALGLLTLSIVALSMVDSARLTAALTAMTVMFIQLIGAMAVLDGMSTAGVSTMSAMSIGLIGMATAILIMAAAVVKMGELNPKELVRGMVAIVSLTTMMVITAQKLANASPQMIAGSIGLVIFSGAIRILVDAVMQLATLNVDSLTGGLIGVGVLITEIAVFMKTTDLSGMGISKAIGIVILAGAINLLAIAVDKMGNLDPDKMSQGLLAIGVILAELTTFINLMNGNTSIMSAALGLTVLAVALNILAFALERLGNMSGENLAKSLISMGVALAIIGGAVQLIPKDILLTGAGLLVVATAMVILSQALLSLGSMSWEEMAIGLTAMAGSMVVLAIGLSAMTGTIAGSAALLIAAAAIAILAPAMKMLGGMSWEEIGKSLLMLVGVFTVIGIAASVLTPVIPMMAALAGTMLLFGIAAAAVGIGVLAFAAGLSALAVSGAAGAAALVVIITSIVGLLPMIVKQIGKALIVLIGVLAEGAPAIVQGIVDILMAIVEGLVKVIPPLVEGILLLLETLLVGIAEKLPVFIQAGYDILIAFLSGILNNLADVISLSLKIVTTFLDGVAARLPEIITSGFNLLISFIDGMTAAVDEQMPRIMDSMRELAGAMIKGLIEGWAGGLADVKDGIMELGQVAIDGFKEVWDIHSPSKVMIDNAYNIVAGFVNGISKYGGLVVDATSALGINAVSSITSAMSKVSDNINLGMDSSPVIRPIIDLTDIETGNQQIADMLASKQINLSSLSNKVSAINTGMTPTENGVAQSVQNDKPSGSVSFVQNNYSPKELSRIDIYRQTKNQLIQLNGFGGAR